MAPNNPRGHHSSERPERNQLGLLPGEGHQREVAAYLLDCEKGFCGVPRTILAQMYHDKFFTVHTDQTQSKTSKLRLGSLQEFVESKDTAGDMGCTKFSTREVHKIGILDIRLVNTDRHDANILIETTRVNNKPYLKFIPIDHGNCLPERVSVCSVQWCWLSWPQAKEPFDEETRNYILAIDIEEDVRKLQTLLDISESSLQLMRICTMLLKKGAEERLTLYDIASIIARDPEDMPSRLETILAQAHALALISDSKITKGMASTDDHFTRKKKKKKQHAPRNKDVQLADKPANPFVAALAEHVELMEAPSAHNKTKLSRIPPIVVPAALPLSSNLASLPLVAPSSNRSRVSGASLHRSSGTATPPSRSVSRKASPAQSPLSETSGESLPTTSLRLGRSFSTGAVLHAIKPEVDGFDISKVQQLQPTGLTRGTSLGSPSDLTHLPPHVESSPVSPTLKRIDEMDDDPVPPAAHSNHVSPHQQQMRNFMTYVSKLIDQLLAHRYRRRNQLIKQDRPRSGSVQTDSPLGTSHAHPIATAEFTETVSSVRPLIVDDSDTALAETPKAPRTVPIRPQRPNFLFLPKLASVSHEAGDDEELGMLPAAAVSSAAPPPSSGSSSSNLERSDSDQSNIIFLHTPEISSSADSGSIVSSASSAQPLNTSTSYETSSKAAAQSGLTGNALVGSILHSMRASLSPQSQEEK